jgi:hypothetical protein
MAFFLMIKLQKNFQKKMLFLFKINLIYFIFTQIFYSIV